MNICVHHVIGQILSVTKVVYLLVYGVGGRYIGPQPGLLSTLLTFKGTSQIIAKLILISTNQRWYGLNSRVVLIPNKIYGTSA